MFIGMIKHKRMIFFKGTMTIESLIGYINNTIDDSERQEVEQWINSRKENRVFFDNLQQIWNDQEDLTALLKENRLRDWQIVESAISDQKGETKQPKKNTLSLIWWKRIAAAVILFLFSIAGYFAGHINNSTQPSFLAGKSQYHQIVVPDGEKSRLELSDGSILWINAGSVVKFPISFSSESRDIWLDGEAYFEVAKDRQRPFLVHTNDVDVRVYGTKFNLKAYNKEDIFEATLIEGRVSLETRDIFNNTKEKVFLEPNQKAIYLKRKPKEISNEISKVVSEPVLPKKFMISKPVSVESAISWREGRLEFFEETLENIAIKLERRYGVVIQMEDKEIRKIRYSGVLKKVSIEQALKAIQMTTDISYEIHDNNVIIKKNTQLNSEK